MVAFALLAPSPPKLVRAKLAPGVSVLLAEEHELFLEATPLPGEGLYSFARRFSGSEAAAPRIAAANGGAKRLLTGLRYRVPYELLRPELRLATLKALFPKDQLTADGWTHLAAKRGALGVESLWRVAEWFTGDREHFAALRESNAAVADGLAAGEAVLIPPGLLLPGLREALPQISDSAMAASPRASAGASSGAPTPLPAVPTDAASVVPVAPLPVSSRSNPTVGALPKAPVVRVETTEDAEEREQREEEAHLVAELVPAEPEGAPDADAEISSASSSLAASIPEAPVPALPAPSIVEAERRKYPLSYGKDADGEFAVYRLQPKEALYSSVVVRFTGRLLASDVNELAEEIAERSRIRDVTDIPVGYRVKIPLDLLLPEYLPAGHPRRREYEAELAATAPFDNRVRAQDLAGVTIILDSGHGGADSGATFAGVWESLYVHDILLRVRTLLESRTAAKVQATIRDGSREKPEDRDVLSVSRAHRVLTTPPYAIEDPVVGTNLRWYLANSIFRKEQSRGVAPEKVVFVSLHADSLHPSLSGAMVYIPDAQLRNGSFGRSGDVYAVRNEYRERPRVAFSWQARVKSEGLSRDLARHIIAAFERNKAGVHHDKPIRERIIRRRSEWVPAVLRYNEVPASILLEVCNLANESDRKKIQTRAHRQKIAESIVDGLLAYYGVGEREGSGTVVAAGR